MATQTIERIPQVTVEERPMTGAVRISLKESKSAFISAEPAVRPKSNAIYIHSLEANGDTPNPAQARQDLLRAAAGHLIQKNADLTHLLAVHAPLELAQTVIDVVGEDNVRIKISEREEYGSCDEMSISVALEHVEHEVPGNTVWELWATLPPEASEWQPEKPVSS